MNGDFVLVPILDQKVSAGPGQELMDTAKIVGKLPFLKRMLRGHEPESARALEVRGDSMTGIQMFDGDIVVFRPGDVAGDGIYVIRIHDVLLVKRIIFDHISGKLSIMSENPRYPEKAESSDSQAVTVIGKVYGWLHAHPY